MLKLAGNSKAVKEVNRRLKAVEKKLAFIYEPERVENTDNFIPKLTESELITLLVEGNGTYWELNGKRFVPLSPDSVVRNLSQKKEIEVDDILYDFNRLREVA